MAAMEPLSLLIGITSKQFSWVEKQLLEADLYHRVCIELKEMYRQQYKNYFRLMNYTKVQEDNMLEEKFLQNILKDILSTNEYDPKGIAIYTDIHEDVIWELLLGFNTEPSAICFRKIIELDRTVRPALYKAIGKKIASELVTEFKEIKD
jgi:hypothetical protein